MERTSRYRHQSTVFGLDKPIYSDDVPVRGIEGGTPNSFNSPKSAFGEVDPREHGGDDGAKSKFLRNN